MKTPSKKDLKKAIQQLEENDDYYQYATDFQGVDILDVEIDADEIKEFGDEAEIHYSAKVYWLDRNEEFYDLSVQLKSIKKFLPTLS